jgi:hypothetical protein
MRWKRWLRNGLIVIALLLGVVLIGGHFLLRSPLAARKAESLLHDMLGADARIDHVAVDLFGSTTASNIQLQDPQAKAPWLRLDQLSANVSALDLLRGALNDAVIKVRGAHARLHFDSGNRLLTDLPRPSSDTARGSAPTVELEDGELTVDQDGRPPLVLSGVSGTLRKDGQNWHIQGNTRDPRWGDWSIQCDYDSAATAATLRLIAERADLTREKLRSLPFVSTAVWDQVEVEGPTRVVISLHLGGTRSFGYRVEAEPLQAKVFVHSIGLESTDSTGTAVAEDRLVTLRNLHGKSAGGEVKANGDLDFRNEPWKLDIRASARKVDLPTFTRKWARVPEQIRRISGQLTGDAKLLLTISDHLSIDGEGEGRVDDARILDLKTDGPIKLRLSYLDGKPQFRTEMSLREKRGPDFRSGQEKAGLPIRPPVLALGLLVLQPPPAQEPRDDLTSTLVDAPAKAVSLLQKGVGYVGQTISRSGKTLMDVLPGGPPRPRDKPVTYFEASFGFKDIDIGQLVQKTGVTVPFPVSGRGSLKVQAALPVETPGDASAYRISGTIDLSRIKVANLELDNVKARVKLDRGVLRLEELRGDVPTSGTKPGSFQGTARMEVAPLGDISANLTLADIPLDRVTSLIPGKMGRSSGTFGGTANWRAPANNLQDLTKWKATATVNANAVHAFGVSLDRASLAARLEKGNQLALENLSARLYEGKLTGSLLLPLRERESGSVDLKLEDMNVGLLAKDLKQLPIKLDGEASGTLKGKIEPAKANGERELTSRLDLTAPKLRVQNVPTEKIEGRFTYSKGIVGYHLEGDALGGKFELDGKVPLGGEPKRAGEQAAPQRQPEPPQAQGPGGIFRFRGASLGKFLRSQARQNVPPPLHGVIDLTLEYATDAAGEVKGTGTAELSGLRWGQRDLSNRLTARLRLEGASLSVPDLSGELLGGSLRVRANLNLRQPDRGTIFVSLDRAEAAQAASILFDDETLLEGPFDLRFRGSLGREWRGGGEAVMARGKVEGIDVSEWRLPYTLYFSPGGDAGELDVRESSASLALGRAFLDGQIAWDGGTRLEVHLRLSEAELRTLARPFGGAERQFGMGRVKGRLDIVGRDVHGAQDLTGRLEADFNQAQALQLPVFSQFAPLLRGVSSATTFEKGDLRATLTRGVWRVSRLTIDSTLLRLVAEGIVTIKGVLDLEVTARTGQLFINPALLRVVGLATGQALPLQVIAQASQWLSNRVIHARVNGTLRNPSVHYEPVRLLTEETIRFFLRSSLPTNVRDFAP